MTMSPDRGGIFATLLGLVRFGMGGRAGDGRQYVSWIHERDFVRAIYWLIEHDEVDGVVNIASPEPIPNADFMRELRAAWGMPFGLTASRWMLELGAIFMRTETELILKSRRVVPRRLVEHGFEFDLPTWREAAEELCRRRDNARAVESSRGLLSAACGLGWGIVAFVVGTAIGGGYLWGGLVASPLIGWLIGRLFRNIRRCPRCGRVGLAAVSLYLAAAMFGGASGVGEAIRLGWTLRFASDKVYEGVLATLWVLTFSGLGLVFWAMAYANHEILGNANAKYG